MKRSTQVKKLEGQSLQEWLGSVEGDWRLVPAPEGLFILQKIDEPGLRENASHLAFCGEIAHQGELTDTLNLISNSRLSGLFHYVSDAVVKSLVFKLGNICEAQSAAPEDRIGEIACRYGALTREQLEEAVRECPVDSRLGAFLVRKKLITSHDLYSFVQRQVEEIFYSLLLVTKGQFYFYRHDGTAEQKATRLILSTQDLLLQGVQRIDEMSYFREKIPSGDLIFEKSSANLPENLGETERTVFALVDGKTDLETITQTSHLGEFEATKAAFQLLQSGHIRPQAADHLGGRGYAAKERGLSEVIAVFNDVFAKIFAEAQNQGQAEELCKAVASFFEGSSSFKDLFEGVSFNADGTLDAQKLMKNVSVVDTERKVDYLYQGLNEFLFFETFVAGETLDSETEERLHERLDEILLQKKRDKPRHDDLELDNIPSDIITFSF